MGTSADSAAVGVAVVLARVGTLALGPAIWATLAALLCRGVLIGMGATAAFLIAWGYAATGSPTNRF